MPPRKNINKLPDTVRKSTPTRSRRETKSNLNSKTLQISVVNLSPNTKNTTSRDVNVERSSNKQEHKNAQLSKRDINIMLANEVLALKFPSKITSLQGSATKTKVTKAKKQEVPKKVPKNKILNPKQTKIKKEVVTNNKVPPVEKKIRKKKSETKTDNDNPKTPIADFAVKESNIKPKTKLDIKLKINNNVKLKAAENNIKLKTKPVAKLKKNIKKECQEAGDNKNVKKKAKPKPKPAVVAKKKIVSKPNQTTVRRGRKKKVDPVESNAFNNVKIKTEVSTDGKGDKPPSPIVAATQKITSLRRASTVSDLSWTRDISSCSTPSCITVSSNDFVRFDNKLPILKLTNINSSCAKENSDRAEVISGEKPTVNEIAQDLALSSSSSSSSSSRSSSSSSSSSSNNESCVYNKNKRDYFLSKLSANLKRFDREVIIWIGYTNNSSDSNVKLDGIKENIFKSNVLLEEKKLLQQYQTIRRLLSKYKKPNAANIGSENTEQNKLIEDENYNEPFNCSNVNQTKFVYTTNKPQQKISSEHQPAENTYSNHTVNNVSSKCPEENYDDDTLSLYAESLTGLDSSKRNSSIQRTRDSFTTEEYVPEFVTNTSSKPSTSYQPTKIVFSAEKPHDEYQKNVVSTVCEKQNADSTSVNKDQDGDKNTTENVIYEDRRGSAADNNVPANVYNYRKIPPLNPIRFVASNFVATSRTKSIVYKNVCMFNLMSCCRSISNCKFPHTIPSIHEIRKRISKLNEESLVTEYMLTRSVSSLQQKFGLCFVHECIERNLTRLLVEMVIDFVSRQDVTDVKSRDTTTEVVEKTLLYLNNVDLNVCQDMLLYNFIKPKSVLLCDYLLKFIAESQNFTRFIPIFIQLTWYIAAMDFRVDIETSILLLERVCILPYEEKLARSLIEVIKRTADSIFLNFMIEIFESLLLASNKDLYDSFVFLKKRKMLNKLVCETLTGAGARSVDKDIRYSPDTTNFDHLNKTLPPKLTRTVDNKVNEQFSTEPKEFLEDWIQQMPPNRRYSDRGPPVSMTHVPLMNRPLQASGSKQVPLKRRMDSPYRGNLQYKIPRLVHSDQMRRNYSLPSASMKDHSNSSSGSEGRGCGGRPRRAPYPARGSQRSYWPPANNFGMERRSGHRFF